jgi:hypothetical protein
MDLLLISFCYLCANKFLYRSEFSWGYDSMKTCKRTCLGKYLSEMICRMRKADRQQKLHSLVSVYERIPAYRQTVMTWSTNPNKDHRRSTIIFKRDITLFLYPSCQSLAPPSPSRARPPGGVDDRYGQLPARRTVNGKNLSSGTLWYYLKTSLQSFPRLPKSLQT